MILWLETWSHPGRGSMSMLCGGSALGMVIVLSISQYPKAFMSSASSTLL